MPSEPSNSTPDATSDQWRDQMLDRALAERLGGDAPPDLSARILAAVEPSSLAHSHGDTTMDSPNSSRRSSVRTWVLAASLLVNCGLVAMLVASSNRESQIAQNGRKSNVEQLRRTFNDQDKLNRGELETAARPATAEVDGKDMVPPPTVDSESEIDIMASTVTPDSWSESREVSGDGNQMTTDSYEFRPPVTDPQLSQRPLSGEVVAEGNIGLQGLVNNGNALLGKPSSPPTSPSPADSSQFESFRRAELSIIPQPNEPPIVYPNEEVWEDLTAQREKRRKVDLEGKEGRGQVDALAALAPADANQPAPAGPNGAETDVHFNRYASSDRGLSREYGVDKGYDHTAMYSQLMDARAPVRLKWGFGGGGGRMWPESEPWQGSPDGQGIGPDAAGDQYDRIHENAFIPAIGGEAISTFSIDVDTASYANVRQMLLNSQVPPADAVRLEEFVNYFDYDYEPPTADQARRVDPFGPKTDEPEAPFAAHVETAACPWQPAHRLVRIGIKGRELAPEKRPLSNLVFLVDVSGSMNEVDKLPLVVHGLKKLAEQLGENDRVAIVVYASSEGLALPSTPGTEKETILAALDSLAAGGSTAGGAGIQLAYQIAEDNFIEGGTNRVILCTDGDFNVGTTSTSELERMVEQKAKDTKVFLSCIGFGRGNLNDAMMEKITGIGNGNYYYADSDRESERIFVKGMTGMLVTIAKDVKIQVEFNPAKVAGYRLLGYENRMLATQDFNDDKKDAGEIGAGHTVTCLYEIVPAGEEVEAADIDELKYQRPAGLTDQADTEELLTLKMRYKKPDGDTSTKLEWPVADSGHKFGEASTDMQFASAVASFGMLLRDSQYKGDTSYDAVIEIAESAKGKDPEGERAEFVELVRAAKKLMPAKETETEAAPVEEKEESNVDRNKGEKTTGEFDFK